MSRFFSEKYSRLTPYVPGEQPRDRRYVKLNTNESPFPPSPFAQMLARQAAADLQLYSDPEVTALRDAAAAKLGVKKDQIMFTNGSDDILNFAFMAFCDDRHPAAFADVTYGFYKVFAEQNRVPYAEIPLNDDFTLPVEKFMQAEGTLFIANPNAPTGLALPLSEVEKIVASKPDRVVVLDEAYVDFGAESAIRLIDKYDNLLVAQTFSKSRSLAGGRLGFVVGCSALIADLQTLRYSTNPYNINSMTAAAGIGAINDTEYFEDCCRKIRETRKKTAEALKALGFTMPESSSNFLFAAHPKVSGLDFYLKLKEMGILVRHFETARLKNYNRITIGSDEQMEIFLNAVRKILEEA